MSKIVYFEYSVSDVVGSLPPGASLSDTIKLSNGYDTGITKYYKLGGTSPTAPTPIDYIVLDISQMTFVQPSVYGTSANVQTYPSQYFGQQLLPLWDARTVADDFVIPPFPIVLESAGNVDLVQIGSYYGLYGKNASGNPTTGPLLQYGGSYVLAGQTGDWAPFAAESIASGSSYKVLFRNAATNQFTVWNTDGGGNVVSGDAAGVVDASSPSIWSYETLFNLDLNGDGGKGPPAPIVIEKIGVTALVAIGGYFGLYAKDGSGNPTTGPLLKYNGAPIGAAQLSPWFAVGAEATGSGYKVLLKNLSTNQFVAWNTDANGNFVSGDTVGVVSASSPDLWTYESLFGQDFSGDGRVGAPTPTSIETVGATALVQVGGYYGLYAKNGFGNPTSGPVVRFAGAPIAITQLAPWSAVGAEVNGAGYKVLFKNVSTNQFVAWNVDASGNYASGDAAGVIGASSPMIWTYETLFGQDFNGDSRIGAPPPTSIETVGATALVQVGGYYGLYAKDGLGNPTTGPLLSYNGIPLAVTLGAAWTPVAAEASGGGFKVLFKNASSSQFTVWNADAGGNYVSGDAAGVIGVNSPTLWSYESLFGQDFNGDSRIGGPAPTPIETVGATALVLVGGYYGLYAKNGLGNPTTGPLLSINGAPLAGTPSSAWAAIGAETNGAGYKVMFKNASTNQFVVWNTDALGNYASGDATGVIVASSPDLWPYEALFGQDFNGDSRIGAPAPASVETTGVTALVQLGGYYGLYGMNGSSVPTTGPLLRYNGAAISTTQLSPWNAVGAEASGAGYKVLFKNASTNQFVAWNTDAAGNYVSSDAAGAVGANSASLLSYEAMFGQDFNGDLAIGTAGPAGSVHTTLSSFTLPTGYQNLTYIGSSAFTGSGNSGNNVIVGGPGDDTLSGGPGADTLTGGLGVDTFVYTNYADSLYTAFDTVTDFQSNDLLKIGHTIGAGGFVTVDGTATGNFGQDLFAVLSGAHAGNLPVNGMSQVVLSGSGADAGQYLVFNDGVAGFNGSEAVLKWTSPAMPTQWSIIA